MSGTCWNRDIKELIRTLAEAEAAIKISTDSQVDAVLDPVTATPMLLRHAQEALLSAKDELEKQVLQRTKELALSNEALAKSEARFREMAELLPDMIYEMDTALNINYANRAAFETFGYSQAKRIPPHQKRVPVPCRICTEGNWIRTASLVPSEEPSSTKYVSINTLGGNTWVLRAYKHFNVFSRRLKQVINTAIVFIKEKNEWDDKKHGKIH